MLALLALPTALAATDPAGFLKEYRALLPVDLDLREAPLPPGASVTLRTAGADTLELVKTLPGTAGTLATSVASLTFRNGSIVDYATPEGGLTCLATLGAPARLDLDCWMTSGFASRGTTPALVRMSLATEPAGPTLTMTPGGQPGGVTFAPRVASRASPAMATPERRFADALRQLGEYNVGVDPSLQGSIDAESSAAGKDGYFGLIEVENVAGLDFHIQRFALTYGALPSRDETVRWELKHDAAASKPSAIVWNVVQYRPKVESDARIPLRCIGTPGAGDAMDVRCWRGDVLKLLGPDPSNVAITMTFRPFPVFIIEMGPGTDSVFTTTAESDLATVRLP